MVAWDCRGDSEKGGGSILVKISRVNILTWNYIIQELKFSINLKFLTTMVGYKRLKESSTKITERDEALIISCRACLFFIVFWWQKKNITFKFKFLFTFKPWLLNSFDLPSFGSELRKRYTLRLFLMCLEKRIFESCSAWGDGGQMAHLVGKIRGRLEVGGNYAN